MQVSDVLRCFSDEPRAQEKNVSQSEQKTRARTSLHKSALIDSVQFSKIYFCKKITIIKCSLYEQVSR